MAQFSSSMMKSCSAPMLPSVARDQHLSAAEPTARVHDQVANDPATVVEKRCFHRTKVTVAGGDLGASEVVDAVQHRVASGVIEGRGSLTVRKHFVTTCSGCRLGSAQSPHQPQPRFTKRLASKCGLNRYALRATCCVVVAVLLCRAAGHPTRRRRTLGSEVSFLLSQLSRLSRCCWKLLMPACELGLVAASFHG